MDVPLFSCRSSRPRDPSRTHCYSPLRIRSSGTFPGQTRNTGQCPVFRSRGGRTGTQDSVLCSGRVRVGGGPKHRTVSCVPVVFWPSWLKDPVRRSRISACCPGRGGPAAWYRRLASIAFHTILFTAAGLGVYCNPPYTPSGVCNVF